jgi:NADPH-dependent glutamate synthase beta subunit-like oxidoreductase/NAD-dependent dihydropyrimidine dehydrogenase PreA subunit
MERNTVLERKFDQVEMFKTCEQCGLCSSACPITGVKNFNIRRILRHVELDLIDEIARSPLPWSCTTCGRCEGVCPNGIAILDIVRPLRSISPEKFFPEGPPCVHACPVGIDVPGYLRFIVQGKAEEAYKLILEKLPFPGILGRVCTHPCENDCRRKEVNEPISICALKRFAADKAGTLPEGSFKVEKETGHKVAVIGAGPAGLTAAFYLRKKGHHVTIFEARSKPGGMMRYGIPDYRLPEKVLKKEINQVLNLGIELKTDKKWGKDFNLNQLKKDGFEAIFIAVGLQLSRRIEMEGSESKDVFWGVDFLMDVNQGKEFSFKEKVLVVGGGNVAVDAARVAKRLGAKEVLLLYRRSRSEMPAIKSEVDEAEREGIKFHFLIAPIKVITNNGRLTGLQCIRMELAELDESGRRSPIPVKGSNFEIEADQIIMAIGQSMDKKEILEELEYSNQMTISVDPVTLKTKLDGVFAGGDVAKGPTSVIEAIEAGRRAASSIDQFLGGDGRIEEIFAERPDFQPYSGKREAGFADLKRVETPTLSVSERCKGFIEVERCFNDDQAIMEASRCLQCDLELRLVKEAPL